MIKNKLIISDLFYSNDYEKIERVNEFFSGMEFRAGEIVDNDNHELLEKRIKLIEKNKVNVFSVHAPFMKCDISIDDEHERVKSVRDIEKALYIAERLNAGNVVVHLSRYINENNLDGRRENALKSLEEINKTAGELKIDIVVENTVKGMFGYNLQELQYFAEKGFLFCIDTGHAKISSFDFIDFSEKNKKQIKMIHLHTNNGKNDEHVFFDKYKNENEKKLIESVKDAFIVFEINNEYSEEKALKIFKEVFVD